MFLGGGTQAGEQWLEALTASHRPSPGAVNLWNTQLPAQNVAFQQGMTAQPHLYVSNILRILSFLKYITEHIISETFLVPS